jgi:hypothetical protein
MRWLGGKRVLVSNRACQGDGKTVIAVLDRRASSHADESRRSSSLISLNDIITNVGRARQ